MSYDPFIDQSMFEPKEPYIDPSFFEPTQPSAGTEWDPVAS